MLPSPQDFDYPLLNASLNGVSFVFLVVGFLMIRAGRKRAHIICMVSALVTSTLFLASYLTYHYLAEGMTKFPAEYPTARKVYLAILASHIPLAALLVPMVLVTVIPALRQRFDRHKRLARFTLPVWLYVSVTGVLIYLMLYQWYPPTAAARSETEGAAITPAIAVNDEVESASAGEATALSFTPQVFKLQAEAEDDVVTARFEVTNSGHSAVRIIELDTSCYCLEVRSDADEIAAGATVIVEADFSLEKLVGTAEKYVIVRTDDPGHSEVRLGVEVTVDPIYSIEPLTLEWKVGEALEPKQIVFKVLREQAIRITGFQATREKSFSVAVEEVEAGRDYRVVLTPKTTDKELLGFVRLMTDCEIEKYGTELVYFKVTRNAGVDGGSGD